jgi:hypothetical protein
MQFCAMIDNLEKVVFEVEIIEHLQLEFIRFKDGGCVKPLAGPRAQELRDSTSHPIKDGGCSVVRCNFQV